MKRFAKYVDSMTEKYMFFPYLLMFAGACFLMVAFMVVLAQVNWWVLNARNLHRVAGLNQKIFVMTRIVKGRKRHFQNLYTRWEAIGIISIAITFIALLIGGLSHNGYL